MKGIIFNLLNHYIEQNYGADAWKKLIESVQPESKGIYINNASYADKEMMDLIDQCATQTNQDPDKLLHHFGLVMFEHLASKYPVFLPKDITLKEFLKTIDNVIHIEVRKIYPDAGLPILSYEDPSPNQLIMCYQSPRKLCHLAEGLIRGAAKYFKQSISLQQTKCMHFGDDYCRIEITFKGAKED